MSKIEVSCNYCGNKFLKQEFHIKKTNNNFCSRKCFGLYRIGSTSTIEKFMSKVNVIDDNTWIWTGGKTGMGYGTFKYKGKVKYVHRLSYEFFKGEIQKGLCVCHADDNPLNIAPNNLWLGSHKDNVYDMIKKGRHSWVGLCRSASLNEKKVLEIRDLCKSGKYNQSEISRMFNVSRMTVSHIVNRKTWKDI